MSERQPYSRVYWAIRHDPKFQGIYSNDRHLATWLRLLIAADATWPAPADIPANARRPSVDALTTCGLVDLLGDGLFTIHGLDAERGRRREAASRGASGTPTGTQVGTNRDPSGDLARGGSRDELSRDELSRDELDAAAALYQRTGTFPSPKVVSWLNDLANAHGEARLCVTIATTQLDNRNVRDYLTHIQDSLRAEDHAAERAEKADEKRRNEEKRKPIRMLPTPIEITPEDADRIAREYMAEFGRQPA